MDLASAQTSDKVFWCQKSGKAVPLAKPRCVNPKAYCKWRTACPIHMLEKESSRSEALPPG